MIFMQPQASNFFRAWKPDRFKTPGAVVNIGTRGDVFVLTDEQRHGLRLINRQWLLTAAIEADGGQPRNGNLPESRSATPEPKRLTNGD
jgi:hypothetical protein